MNQMLEDEKMNDDEKRVEQAITAFVAEKAMQAIGDDCVVGTSIIVFEFIAKDGRIGHGVLRQKGVDAEECLDLLCGATESIMGLDDRKFPYDAINPDDL